MQGQAAEGEEVIISCPYCGGLGATEDMEMFAGTPCQCGGLLKDRWKHDTQDQRPRLSPSLAHIKEISGASPPESLK